MGASALVFEPLSCGAFSTGGWCQYTTRAGVSLQRRTILPLLRKVLEHRLDVLEAGWRPLCPVRLDPRHVGGRNADTIASRRPPYGLTDYPLIT